MNDETRAEVDRWLVKADRDLAAARILSNPVEPKRDIAVYHCQQAAEKALKAWLIANAIRFEKSHDLQRLLALCPPTRLTDALLEAAQILTPYSTEFRYPGDVLEPNSDECDEAIRLAHTVLETIQALVEKMISDSNSQVP